MADISLQEARAVISRHREARKKKREEKKKSSTPTEEETPEAVAGTTPTNDAGGETTQKKDSSKTVAQPTAQPATARPAEAGEDSSSSPANRDYRTNRVHHRDTGLDYLRTPAEAMARIRDGRMAMAMARNVDPSAGFQAVQAKKREQAERNMASANQAAGATGTGFFIQGADGGLTRYQKKQVMGQAGASAPVAQAPAPVQPQAPAVAEPTPQVEPPSTPSAVTAGYSARSSSDPNATALQMGPDGRWQRPPANAPSVTKLDAKQVMAGLKKKKAQATAPTTGI